jgi:Tfp pilus assembly protein PilX
MSRLTRLLRAERGIAMITVMLAIFILTVLVSALAIATMGESTLSFDQLRGQQALSVAEAGAYRALAELRRRVETDLDTNVTNASSIDPVRTENDVHAMCTETGSPVRRNVELITMFANPTAPPASDWTLTGPDGSTATLAIGSAGSPVQMTDQATGTMIGTFYALIAVRSSGAPADCRPVVAGGEPPRKVFWFDYAILSVGRTSNATRTVCLRSGFADRCPDWFPAATGVPSGSYVLQGANPTGWRGWPVLVTRASYSRWALMLLDVGDVWLFTGTTINGPVHSNTRLRIAGNPRLNDAVTQVNAQMNFFNCSGPPGLDIPIPSSSPNATLQTPCDNTAGNVFGSTVVGGAAGIAIPTNANPSRTSIGLSASGPNATDQQVREHTTGLPDGPGPVPDGVWVMDQCATPGCGGIYIRGDVQQMVLSSENNMQVIRVTTATNPDPTKQNMKIIINPATKSVTTCWNLSGPDPGTGDCSGWAGTQTYSAGTFNGIVYVSGGITYDPDPAASTGLYGVVNRGMKLTIATENELSITDHLVYDAPPAGPGHNTVNVLGLYSVTGNVMIEGALITQNDLYIDAVVLSPSGKFEVRDWNRLPVKGNIYTLGGTVQGTFGAFGGFSPDTGFGRVMTYDWRLRSNVSPPFFPLTDIYTALRYPSPEPEFSNGDPLYDRPQWEEMVGL